MVKAKPTDHEGNAGTASALAAIPGVEKVEPVSGKYDFLITAAVAPGKAAALASTMLAKAGVAAVEVLKAEPQEANPFLDEVLATPGGEGVSWCIQCGVCSGSCPNVARMELSPRRTIAKIRAGKRREVLTSNTPWICASCYMCTVRCPRDVKPTELMHALERLAIRHGLRSPKVTTPAMYGAFVESVKSNGRVFEVGMMMNYYLKTNPVAALRIAPVGLKLLTHGRMSLKASKIKGTEQIKAMINKARALGGEQ